MPSLVDLNPYVQVSAITGAISDKEIASYGAVIVTSDLPKEELVGIDRVCRTQKPTISFVMAQTHGVTGLIFTDFGANHVVTDRNGEPRRSLVVHSIDHVSGRVKCVKDHKMHDGDLVSFEETTGPNGVPHLLTKVKQIKVKQIYTKVKRINPRTHKEETRTMQVFDTFQIDLDSLNEQLAALNLPKVAEYKDIGEATSGGIVNEVKPHYVFDYRALEESLHNPLVSEQDKMNNAVGHADQSRYLPPDFVAPEQQPFARMGSRLPLCLLGLAKVRPRKGSASSP